MIFRKHEFSVFEKYFQQDKATLIGVDGRRRVGKTTDTNSFINKMMYRGTHKNIARNMIYFNFIGNLNFSSKQNITFCIKQIQRVIDVHPLLQNRIQCNYKGGYSWNDFFIYLQRIIAEIRSVDEKMFVFVFFDEISWYDKKNQFIHNFSNFWNTFGALQQYMMFFMASSCSTWITDKLFKDTKTLYARINERIKLVPFSIRQIYEYAKEKNTNISKEDVLKYYLMFGGIIKYYDLVDFNKTFEENIDFLVSRKEFIESEYSILFDGLFSTKQHHRIIVEQLCKSKTLTLQTLSEKLKVDESILYKNLQDLIHSGLIRVSKFDRTNSYTIADSFCYFYYYWFKLKNLKDIKKFDASFSSWQGTAFEIAIFANNDILNVILGSDNNRFYLNWERNKQIDILVEKGTKSKSRYFTIIELKSYDKTIHFTELGLKNIESKCDNVIDNYQRKNINVNVDVVILGTNNITLNDYPISYNVKCFNVFDLF